MADHVDPHDETPSAPFRRVLSLIDGLPPTFKPSDETPLREAMPGGWPTIGEFRSFLNSIQPPPPSTHVAGAQNTIAVDREVLRDIAQLLSGSMFTFVSTEEKARERGSELYALLATTEGQP